MSELIRARFGMRRARTENNRRTMVVGTGCVHHAQIGENPIQERLLLRLRNQQWQTNLGSNLKKGSRMVRYAEEHVFVVVGGCVGRFVVQRRTLTHDIVDRQRTQIPEPFRPESVEHGITFHSQRGDQSEYRRKVQQDAENAHVEMHDETSALHDCVWSYNDTYHRSIGMAPSSVIATNQERVWQNSYGHDG